MLREWEQTLDALERDPMSLKDRLDWVAKKWLLESFMESEGIGWDDPWLQSLDLEYHNIDPNQGLYYDLERQGSMKRVLTEDQIEQASIAPPADTRAFARAKLVRALSESRVRYIVDWDSVYLENEHHLSFRDPFYIYEEESTEFVSEIKSIPPGPSPPMRRRRR